MDKLPNALDDAKMSSTMEHPRPITIIPEVFEGQLRIIRRARFAMIVKASRYVITSASTNAAYSPRLPKGRPISTIVVLANGFGGETRTYALPLLRLSRPT